MQKLVIFTGLIALVSGRGILRESCPPKPPTVLDFDAAKVRFFITFNDLLKTYCIY